MWGNRERYGQGQQRTEKVGGLWQRATRTEKDGGLWRRAASCSGSTRPSIEWNRIEEDAQCLRIVVAYRLLNVAAKKQEQPVLFSFFQSNYRAVMSLAAFAC